MGAPLPVVIIGAGLAGLACAIELQEHGVPFILVEGSDRVGGRLATDKLHGFTLDRGFQVLLTAYPECQRLLDYSKLKLNNFHPGALVWSGNGLQTVIDPFRDPGATLATLFAPIGSVVDKYKVWMLKEELIQKPLEEIFSQKHPDTTMQALRKYGFSDGMIKKFFNPFLRGIFLEHDLTTSSKMFEFVFKMFSEGNAALPADGMQAIPEQLVSKIPADSIMLKTKAIRIVDNFVELDSGVRIEAKSVVVATEGSEAGRLIKELPAVETHAVTCLYFEAPVAPIGQPILVLNGESEGIVNNVCVPSNVSATYGNGKNHLISVSVIGNPFLDDVTADTAVKKEMKAWFGDSVLQWRLLRVYRVVNALPAEPPSVLDPSERNVRISKGLFVCGDHRDNGSINGALISGKRTALEVLAEVG